MPRRKVTAEVSKKLSKAQKGKPCAICGEGGRTVGRLGEIELNYCGHHRKYGERVLNFFANSLLGYKLTNLLNEVKSDLFMKNIPELSEESYKKIEEYTNSKIRALDELKSCEKKLKK